MDESCLWEHLVKQSFYHSMPLCIAWFSRVVCGILRALESFYHMIIQLKPHESHHEGTFIAQQLVAAMFPQIDSIALEMEF